MFARTGLSDNRTDNRMPENMNNTEERDQMLGTRCNVVQVCLIIGLHDLHGFVLGWH